MALAYSHALQVVKSPARGSLASLGSQYRRPTLEYLRMPDVLVWSAPMNDLLMRLVYLHYVRVAGCVNGTWQAAANIGRLGR